MSFPRHIRIIPPICLNQLLHPGVTVELNCRSPLFDTHKCLFYCLTLTKNCLQATYKKEYTHNCIYVTGSSLQPVMSYSTTKPTEISMRKLRTDYSQLVHLSDFVSFGNMDTYINTKALNLINQQCPTCGTSI